MRSRHGAMQLDALPKEGGGGIDQVVMGKLGCHLRLPAGGDGTTPCSSLQPTKCADAGVAPTRRQGVAIPSAILQGGSSGDCCHNLVPCLGGGGRAQCVPQEASNVILCQQGDAAGQAEEAQDVFEVAPTVPGRQVVHGGRGTRREGLADVGWSASLATMSGSWVLPDASSAGGCRSRAARVTNLAVSSPVAYRTVSCGVLLGRWLTEQVRAAGRAAEVMRPLLSTAYPPLRCRWLPP